MEQNITVTFQTKAEADRAAHELMARGIPETSIQVESCAFIDEEPAAGPSLGGGVSQEAVIALVEAHDGEVADEEDAGTYIVRVDTMGDANREAACQEVFGYVA